MVSEPFISIIIPCHNVEDFIIEALESINSQAYQNIEIILVDNNCSDRSMTKAKSYLQTKKLSFLIVKENKQSASSARNRGLNNSKGEWIQFLDADDIIFPKKIASQIILASSSISWIAGGFQIRGYDGEIIQCWPNSETIKGLFHGLGAGFTSSNLWNKNKLLEAGGWNEELNQGQDTELMMRLIRNGGKVTIDANILTEKREGISNQISSKNPEEKYRIHSDLRLDFLKFLAEDRSGYYRKNKEKLKDETLKFIRGLSIYNMPSAKRKYERLVRNHGKLSIRKAKANKGIIILLISIIGFKNITRLLEFLRTIFNLPKPQ